MRKLSDMSAIFERMFDSVGDGGEEGTPSSAEVLAAAEHGPVTPLLAARVLGIDPATLDADGRVGLAVALARIRNAAQGRLAEVIAADVAATPAIEAAGRRVRLSPVTQTSIAMAAALRLGNGAADTLVSQSVALATRHPRTLAAARDGAVSWDKATVLADSTLTLTARQAAEVEDRVLPKAAERVPSQHRAAVQRAVEAVDPDGAAERHRRAREDVCFIRQHHGNGVGELFARMPAEQLDTVWTGADRWARRRKAAGDERTLETLRVAALVQWASSFLVHGDSAHCDGEADRAADDSSSTAATESASPPTQHGRPVTVGLLWHLPGLLGLSDEGGLLLDTGAPLAADTLHQLMDRGLSLRRMVVDPDTGELLDVTARSWPLLPSRPGPGIHPEPYTLFLALTRPIWHALATGDVTGLAGDDADLVRAVAAAIDGSGEPMRDALRSLLAQPIEADALDATPAAESVPPALAEFVALRDRHPATPTAAPTGAMAGDADHTRSLRDGGHTVRDNLATPTRRWHVARTHGGWTVHRAGRQLVWTSSTGRRYRVEPHDYRLGP